MIIRIFTGIILAIVITFLFWLGRFPTTFCILFFSVWGVVEFYRLSDKAGVKPSYINGAIASLVIVLSYFYFSKMPLNILISIFITFIYITIAFLFRKEFHSHPLTEIAVTVFGLIYIPVLLSTLILLRDFTQYGKWYLIFVVAINSLNDTGAYFVGKSIGKYKLWPSISPNKTIEGAIGGFLTSIAATYIFNKLFLLNGIKIIPYSYLLTAFICIFGLLGDLFESLLKREAGLKDTGDVLKGHGGILDRIDSIIFSAPISYFFILLVFHLKGIY